MKTVKLSELFDIYNGYASSNVDLIDKSDDAIYYIRPSNTYEGTIAGYVNKNYVPEKYIFPKNTIYVSTDGEGSQSYTYVSKFDFVPNSNVAVLIPKNEMTLREKQYYALCITKNRYKFSYGRKPKGDRLANILLPDRSEIPDWVYTTKVPDIEPYKDQIDKYLRDENNKLTIKPNELYDLIKNGFFDKNESFNNNPTPELNTDNWKEFKLVDLFELENGKGYLSNEAQENPGKNPFVCSSESNNGIACYTSLSNKHKGNCITINKDGSVGCAFYQEKDFSTNKHVIVATPKFKKFNKYIAMFIIPIIELEKFRYSFGRAWGLDRMKTTVIKLPITPKGEPDYQFMEDYIKTLPYSKYI